MRVKSFVQRRSGGPIGRVVFMSNLAAVVVFDYRGIYRIETELLANLCQPWRA